MLSNSKSRIFFSKVKHLLKKKTLYLKNGYPTGAINYNINDVLNKQQFQIL